MSASVQNGTAAYNGIQFQPAVKHEAKLRFAIAGPAGSGKTYTALSLATALKGKVAVIDTEHGSASKYADLWSFDVLELNPPYHPDRYTEAIKVAGEAGYDALVIDSMSHAWFGPGGLLEVVDKIAAQMKMPNTFIAWKEATPIQQRFIEAVLSAPMHMITCLRSKTGYDMNKDDRGRTIITKVGMDPIQRDGVEYEFDLFAEMTVPDNKMVISKSRCTTLNGQVFTKPTGEELAGLLVPWLSGAKRPHWSEDEGKRAYFLTKLGEHGLDDTAVKNMLGLAELSDWPGTAKDLLDKVRGVINVPAREG